MRAVWSFWSKPWRQSVLAPNPWASERYQWLSWVLSVETARRHYPEVALVADSEGAAILVDELGLEFSDVSTELDSLQDVNPQWWAMGKIYAYRAQTRPFVHIDFDVYLWKRLPQSVELAPVLAQSPEVITDFKWYQAQRVSSFVEARGGAVPEEWRWYQSRPLQIAANCGIVGGNDISFIRHYAESAIRTVIDACNVPCWKALGDVRRHVLLVEQYLLSACLEYRRTFAPSDGRELYIQYLFPTCAFHRAVEVGFTHLLFDAKRNPKTLASLEKVVRRDYPALYERCVEYSKRTESHTGSQLECTAT